MSALKHTFICIFCVSFVFMCTALAFPQTVFAEESDDGEADEGWTFPVLYYSGSNKMQYTNDHISDTSKFENELAVDLSWGKFDGYFRISNDRSFPSEKKSIELEKVTIRWHGPSITVTGGDFSALFGQGLALNCFEAQAIDFDNELTGGKLDIEVGPALLTILKGDFKTDEVVKKDEIEAAHLGFNIGSVANIGGSYVSVKDDRGEFMGTQEYTITGVDGTLDFKQANITGEYVEYNQDDDEAYEDGSGWIVSAAIYGREWSLYGGMYDYKHIASQFAVPATFKEHPEHGGADGNDEEGYGIKATWSPEALGSFDFNYAQANIQDGGFPYTEAVFMWTAPQMGKDSIIVEGRHFYDILGKENNAIVEWQRTLNSDYLSSVAVEYTLINDIFGIHREYTVGLGIDYNQQFSVDYEHEFAAFKIPQKNRWDKVVLKYTDPEQKYDVRLLFGSQRAGIQCLGGICQQVPEFKGYELTFNLYF